jgi:hypothetical protein
MILQTLRLARRGVAHATASALVALALVACGGGANDNAAVAGRWRAEVDTIADTVVVRTTGGSDWGTSRLVEELRIGVADGADHLMFGQVGAIAVRANGEILVYDGQATALRRFGPDGTFLGTISREGSGPGEYRNAAGMTVLRDGRLVLHDFGNSRFNVYSADTSLLATWSLPTDVAEWRPVHAHDGGSIYLYDQVRREGERERRPILVRLDAQGDPGDTTEIQLVERETPGLEVRSATRSVGALVPFHPLPHWTVTPRGELVTVDGARYAIDIHRRDGSVLRLARGVADVPVSEAERVAEEERITARFRRFVPTWNWDGPRIPATKPPIDFLHAGEDGSLWVRVAQPGTAIAESERVPGLRSFVREPLVFDVFAPDGRFRGQVLAPDAMQLLPYPVLSADRVWAVLRDDDGINYVVRFRIVRD